MFRLILMLVGASCLVMLALMVISPLWRRIVLSVVALLLARNAVAVPPTEAARAPEDVIEGEFRVIQE